MIVESSEMARKSATAGSRGGEEEVQGCERTEGAGEMVKMSKNYRIDHNGQKIAILSPVSVFFRGLAL